MIIKKMIFMAKDCGGLAVLGQRSRPALCRSQFDEIDLILDTVDAIKILTYKE